MTPLLMLGAGRMGGALIEGWRAAGAFSPRDLIIRDPYPGDVANTAAKLGARLNPPDSRLAEAGTVLVCVKPQIWREAAAQVEPLLASDAVVVSIAAGVKSADLAGAFGGRRVARIMPTTAVAIRQGVASVFAEDAEARRRGAGLRELTAWMSERPATFAGLGRPLTLPEWGIDDDQGVRASRGPAIRASRAWLAARNFRVVSYWQMDNWYLGATTVLAGGYLDPDGVAAYQELVATAVP